MADWSWSIGPGASSLDSRPVRELVGATGRTVTRRTRAASTAQFTLDARSDEALEIVDKVSDLWVWRDGVRMFRGRITVPDDTVDTRHSVTFTAMDYRGMMSTRTVGAAPVEFDQVDQAEIVWELVAATQARPGGDWGIVRGLVPADPVLRDRLYPAGKSLADAIAEVADVEDGFEWEVSPELVLNVWSPRRGRINPIPLAYGTQIRRVSGTGSGTGFGNALIAVGSDETTPVVAEAPDVATDPRGRWEIVDASPTVKLQSTLAERAPARLVEALANAVPLTAEFAAGAWTGPGDVWIGDPVRLTVNSGRLGTFDGRVSEITLVPGASGSETVTVAITPNAHSTLEGAVAARRNELTRRLRALELAVATPTP